MDPALLQLLQGIRNDVQSIQERLQHLEESLTAAGPQAIPHVAEEVMAPFYGLTANDGLHTMKDKWRQISYLADQCGYLVAGTNFADACRATRNAAPHRGMQGLQYLGPRNERPDPDMTMRESRLERAMFSRWGNPDAQPVAGAWLRIMKYQVPLKEKRKAHAGMKAIDLLGVKEEDGLPVVIELKVMKDTPETPLRAILEAAAYACVLQEAWKPHLRRELGQWLEKTGMHYELREDTLPQCRLIIAAPRPYWTYWSNNPHMQNAATAYQELIETSEIAGFPIRFVCVEGTGDDWLDRLPRDWQDLSASILDDFPPM